MTFMMENRLARLRRVLHEQEREALLITGSANRRYISGFRGSTGELLITAAQAYILTDFRYRVQSAQEAPAFTLRETAPERPLETVLAALVEELGLQQLACEAQHITLAQYNKLSAALAEKTTTAPVLQPVEQLVEPLREVKDAEEVATLRQAIALTDAALAAVLPLLQPQHSERQAAWMLEAAMRERGAEAVAFPVMVAAGRNAALPHAQPGDAPLGSGQPIIIDMGARYQGYHADMTRTIVLGEPDERFWQIYHTVLRAQKHAIAQVRPGMSGSEADALAREQISAAGLGEFFGHGTGHGVGLAIHEGPSLRRTSSHTLRAGNVFSIEPGIYLPDWGGVRIEDLVLLGEDGGEVLTQTRPEPLQT
jgi:Xaa-Pro aminopeptidase